MPTECGALKPASLPISGVSGRGGGIWRGVRLLCGKDADVSGLPWGASLLQYVDMNSSRNLFIFGFSIYCGLAIPNWVNKNPERLQTGDSLSSKL